MVIAPSDFRDEELFETKKIFEEEECRVDVCSCDTGKIRGMLHSVFNVSLKITDANVCDYDAVVFVGGIGVEKHKLYKNLEYIDLAKEANLLNKTIGAICLAPKILAGADLLISKRATVHISAKEYLHSKGAIFVNKNVVVDRNIVTGNGPSAIEEFALAISNKIKKFDKAKVKL